MLKFLLVVILFAVMVYLTVRVIQRRGILPPPRRSAPKKKGRASVPSWDEIMFGGPSEQ